MRGILPGTPRYPAKSHGVPWEVPRDAEGCGGGILWHPVIFSMGSSTGPHIKAQLIVKDLDRVIQAQKRDISRVPCGKEHAAGGVHENSCAM